MFNFIAAATLVTGLFLFGGTAQAGEKEPAAVVAIGPESEWAFPGSTFCIGPSASVEFGVVKDWLEIEIGAGTLFRRSQTEWEADVLFKKPFTLTDTVELMVGAGPSWSYSTGETGKTGTTFVLDFMFWPWPERKFGWFLEPTYSPGRIEARTGLRMMPTFPRPINAWSPTSVASYFVALEPNGRVFY